MSISMHLFMMCHGWFCPQRWNLGLIFSAYESQVNVFCIQNYMTIGMGYENKKSI